MWSYTCFRRWRTGPTPERPAASSQGGGCVQPRDGGPEPDHVIGIMWWYHVMGSLFSLVNENGWVKCSFPPPFLFPTALQTLGAKENLFARRNTTKPSVWKERCDIVGTGNERGWSLSFVSIKHRCGSCWMCIRRFNKAFHSFCGLFFFHWKSVRNFVGNNSLLLCRQQQLST